MKLRVALLVVVLAPLAASLGCPATGIICDPPDTRCGPGCALLSKDPANCGACGRACGSGFICQNGGCECDPTYGLTTCGQSCVDVRVDANNCGACGMACPAADLCDTAANSLPTCVSFCSPGHIACGSDCVDVTSDRNNCGSCGAACNQGAACSDGGCTATLEVICYNSGQLFEIDAEAEVVGNPVTNPPYSPIGLAFHGAGHSVVADEQSNELYSFDIGAGGDLQHLATDGIGRGAASVTVYGDRAYVVTSEHTLDVIDLSAATDAGSRRICPPGTACTASVVFADKSFPQYVAITADAGEAYVSLQGDTTDSGPDLAGNRIAAVNLATLQIDSITAIPFRPDAGYEPRPQGIAVVGGRVFVALANLTGFTAEADGTVDVFTFLAADGSPLPAGAGLTLVQQNIDLTSNCINAGAVLLVNDTLFVACGPQYSSTFTSVVKPGALSGVNINTLTPLAAQPFSCPDAGCEAGGALRMAYAAGKIFIGDSINGRLFTADPTTGAILRGPSNPIMVCPAASDGGYNFIADVAAP